MPFYLPDFIVAVVFAIFFYRAGETENSPGLLWAALSVLISLLILEWLRWGVFAVIVGQIGLLVGIGVLRGPAK